MFVLEHSGRSHQTDGAGDEDRLGISHPEGLQALHDLKEFGIYLCKREFGIEIKPGLEVSQGQARAGISIEMGSQLRHTRGRQREADGVRVSTEASEQSGAGFECVQEMKCSNRPARAVGLFAVARNYQCWASIALDDPRSRDADHSAVPALAINHDAERIA